MEISKYKVNNVKRKIDPIKLFELLEIQFDIKGDRLWCVCPLPEHKDNAPSFTTSIDPESEYFGNYKCFGCGEYGDFIQLIQNMKIVSSFEEAVLWLDEAFSNLEYIKEEDIYDLSWINGKSKDRYRKLRMSDVVTYKNFSEWESPYKEYMVSREIDNNNILEAFRIGYMKKNKVCNKDICTCGRDDDKPCRYNDRIIFPVITNRELVDIQARSVNKNNPVKMMTPPGVRKPALFGQHVLNPDLDFCYITEGPFDVLSIVHLGFTNVVGILTSRLSPEQADLLKNYKRWILVPDMDNGLEKKEINQIMIDSVLPYKHEHDLWICNLPNGTDPNDYYISNPEDMIKKLKHPIRYKLDHSVESVILKY